MATFIKAFDPTKVPVTIGLETVTGFAPDTKVVISRNNSVSTVTEGVDGDISVNLDSRFSGKATISLLNNSPFVSLITAWVASTQATGFPFLPFEMKDPSGQSITTVCWVEEQPDYTISQETGTQDWVFGIQDSRLLPTQTAARTLAAYNLATTVI